MEKSNRCEKKSKNSKEWADGWEYPSNYFGKGDEMLGKKVYFIEEWRVVEGIITEAGETIKGGKRYIAHFITEEAELAQRILTENDFGLTLCELFEKERKKFEENSKSDYEKLKKALGVEQ